MPRYVPEPVTGGMVSAAWLLPLLASLVLPTLAMAEDMDDVDHVAAAKEAWQSLHDACDEWAKAQAKGKETAPAAVAISSSYVTYIQHIAKTNYLRNALLLVLRPENIKGAGELKRRDGSRWSYVLIGRLGMSVFKREKWTPERVPPHGVGASLEIQPAELRSKFTVGAPTAVETDKQTTLYVPYKLKDVLGIIVIRPSDTNWEMKPDRGVVEVKGSTTVWRPFGDE